MEERYCPVCGKNLPLKQFIIDYRTKGHFLPCCKSCTDKAVREHEAEYSLGGAIWCAAMMNHVPMRREVWEKARKDIIELQSKSPFAMYYHAMRDVYGTYENVWESDCWLGDFIEIVKPIPEIVSPVIEEAEEQVETIYDIYTPEELQQIIKDWGKFVDENGELDNNAYDYVISRYNEYIDGINGLTNAMSMQYRNLCKAEWQKIKADESGDIGQIDKAQKLVNGLLRDLKLDDFAVDKSDTDRFIDRLIWRLEETEPAEEEDEKLYVDIAGYEKMYNSMMRSMRNAIAGTRDYPEIPVEEM